MTSRTLALVVRVRPGDIRSGSSPRPATALPTTSTAVAVVVGEDPPDRLAEIRDRATGRRHATRDRPVLGWLDVGAAPLPVQVGDPPGPARQQEDRGAVVAAAEEGRLVHRAQLMPAVEDREQRRRGEGREQLQEVLA